MRLKAHLALLSVALIYGANYTIAKNVLDQDYLKPNGFILLRVISGFVLFTILHALFIKEKVDRKDLGLLAICGLFGIAINQLFFFKGLGATSPVHASLIMVVTPIIVLILSSIYLTERIRWWKVLGIIVGMIGAMLLITKGSSGNNSMSSSLGDLYILINATSYALYLVFAKNLMKKYHPFTVMKWIFSFGLIVVIPFGSGDLSGVVWSSFPIDIWVALIYVLVFTTFFAYLLNAYALSTVNPTTASAYIYMQPLIASTIAVLWYNDSLSSVKVLSAALIFIGVYMISLQKRKRNV
ncbi:MAG: DMT family transporter [Saprospiraceae bacterium]